jgi:hydrogenase expression/formation protein HypC
MCLAIPGKVMEIDRAVSPVMGEVEFAGIRRTVCLDWLPDARVGDYVIVHVGFAISRIDEREALETLQLLKEMGDLREELGDGSEEPPNVPRG